jgi:hypothetical protein
MRTLQIEISEEEFNRLRLPREQMSLAELKKYLAQAQWTTVLQQTQQAAAEARLDQMTLADINAEIQAARNHD